MKKHKYNASPVYYNPSCDYVCDSNIVRGLPGFIFFASKWELSVYKSLLELTNNVLLQQRFKLIESSLVVDFVLITSEGNLICIEAKGYQTQLWKLKFKQFRSLYPDIRIFVIRTNTELVQAIKFLSLLKFRENT